MTCLNPTEGSSQEWLAGEVEVIRVLSSDDRNCTRQPLSDIFIFRLPKAPCQGQIFGRRRVNWRHVTGRLAGDR